jgi:hypothetical protein
MNSAKVCGYGVKVSASDQHLDVRGAVKRLAACNPLFIPQISSFFSEPALGEWEDPADAFAAFAQSLKDIVEENLFLFEFVFLEGPAFSSFALVARDASEEVTDGNIPDARMDDLIWADFKMVQMFTNEILPNHKAEWLVEDIDPHFVGKWRVNGNSPL